MKRFPGIEGLRAWLAWTVVISHIVTYSGLSSAVPHLETLVVAGGWAVIVFIIISGFVISHLILSAHEDYWPYITRRLLRIYPAYIVCLVIAIFVTPFGYEAFLGNPWGGVLANTPIHAMITNTISGDLHEMSGLHLLWHAGLSALLMQGVVPDSLLLDSSSAILNPAWTLTLEWQFYLVAPLIVSLCLRSKWGLVVAVSSALFAAFSFGMFGRYGMSSVLPLSGPYFLIGIATRFFIDKIPQLASFPTILILSGFVLTFIMAPQLVALVVWAGIVCYMKCNGVAVENRSLTLRILTGALDGRLASAAGERSYSVYLFHWIVVCGMLWVAARTLGLSSWAMLVVFGGSTIFITIIGSELLYRFVEKPGIRLGKRLAHGSSANVQPIV